MQKMTMKTMKMILLEYLNLKDIDMLKNVTIELERLEKDYDDARRRAQEFYDSDADDESDFIPRHFPKVNSQYLYICYL